MRWLSCLSFLTLRHGLDSVTPLSHAREKISVGSQMQAVVELRLDNALGQSPPLPTPQQASLNGKPKYRTSTSTLSLSGTTSGDTLVVIPGYQDSAGWFGALKSQDGNFQFSGPGPDPGGRLTITSKAGGSDTKKCKHPF